MKSVPRDPGMVACLNALLEQTKFRDFFLPGAMEEEDIASGAQALMEDDIEDAVSSSGFPEIREIEEFISRHYEYFKKMDREERHRRAASSSDR
jgi:hypothetical protein